MRLQKILTVSFIALFLASCSSAKLPAVPFETGTVSLSENDRAEILEIARLASDKRIEKVTARYALPSDEVMVFVAYQADTLGSYIIDTTLTVLEKNPRNRVKAFVDSFTISRGKWGTKPDLLRREVLRIFDIDETRIILNLPDGMSYAEMRRLLEAVKNYQIIWDDPRPTIKEFTIQEISRVTLEGPEPLFVLSIVKQHSPPFYFVYARFEEGRLVVKRTDEAMP